MPRVYPRTAWDSSVRSKGRNAGCRDDIHILYDSDIYPADSGQPQIDGHSECIYSIEPYFIRGVI